MLTVMRMILSAAVCIGDRWRGRGQGGRGGGEGRSTGEDAVVSGEVERGEEAGGEVRVVGSAGRWTRDCDACVRSVALSWRV